MVRGWFNFLTRRKRKVHPEPTPYAAAGMVFTDGHLILAAQQPYKKVPIISGIGGSKENGETFPYTAMRETLEELFDYKDLPKSMIEDLVERFPSTKVLHNGTYMCGIFTFKDLERLLTRVKRYRIRSPVYPEFPDTIMKLLFTRKPDSKAELSHLVLLPLIETIKISSHLTEDIPEIKRLLRE